MKLIDNAARPAVQPIRLYFEMIGKRKIHIMVAGLFLIGSFFLSQAVLFDAAVPFFLPIWALAQVRLESISYGFSSAGCLAARFLGWDKLLFIYCNWRFSTGSSNIR